MIDNNVIMNSIKRRILKEKEAILSILKNIERENVAVEEIELSINALNNNYKYSKKNNLTCSSYLPMNLPLYSLITYVVIPRRNANKCYYRPSSKTTDIAKKIHEILKLDDFDIELVDAPRYQFLNNYANKSNVVVFVGRPENAKALMEKLNNNIMLIYYGVGQNTVVVEKDANIEMTGTKILNAILFNYGQDCAKPNVILVNRKIFEQLKDRIILEINNRIDDNKTTIKKLEALKEVSKLLVEENENISYGGDIDFFNKTLSPVVISKKLEIKKDIYKEYFAPVIRLMIYDNINDLKKYFSEGTFKKENMNISLFGTNEYVQNMPDSIILNDSIVSEIDNGYSEYGGYGENVSFLSYKGIKIIKPLLINREIEKIYDNPVFDSEFAKISAKKKNLKPLLYYEINEQLHNLFKNKLIFSFVFGSYAKNSQRQTSDVDIFSCISKVDELEISQFREWYFDFHYKYGLFPDFSYPGEIITENELCRILNNNKNIDFDVINSPEVYDALFYTQILIDKKANILGNDEKRIRYEIEARKYVNDWCNRIYELLIKKDLIKNDRENMKCLIALANNDLLFFAKKLQFEEISAEKYIDLVKKIDDGFFMKSLKLKK